MKHTNGYCWSEIDMRHLQQAPVTVDWNPPMSGNWVFIIWAAAAVRCIWQPFSWRWWTAGNGFPPWWILGCAPWWILMVWCGTTKDETEVAVLCLFCFGIPPFLPRANWVMLVSALLAETTIKPLHSLHLLVGVNTWIRTRYFKFKFTLPSPRST